MIRTSSRSILAIALVLALALAGCSSNRRLATQAVGFNLALEKAQNEMLLLNVIRAKDRLPMHLTGISSLSGNVQTTLTSGLGATHSRTKGTTDTLTRTYLPSASATISKNPTFTLAVLDTQEFMRGFLSPIVKDTLAHYWDQGWPPELLLYLLVLRVEIETKQSSGPKVFLNYPDSDDESLLAMKHFGLWVQCEFLVRKPQLEVVPVAESLGPDLPESKVLDLEKLVVAAKEGLLVRKVDAVHNVYQLQRERADLRFKLGPRPSVIERRPECAALEQAAGQTPAPVGTKSDQPSALQQKKYDQDLANEPGRMGVELTDAMTVTFVLRSPEALVYYLGELMRVANREESPKVPYVCIQNRYQPLFVALPADRCDEALLAADSGRGKFSIPPLADPKDGRVPDSCPQGALRFEDPECQAGRSMQAIRLLSQLMSLQKSAKDLPTPALVRVVGE